jgi:hypothetical protein
MVVTRHVDCAATEGERRWMKQNHHDECCHLFRKKLLVTVIFMQLHAGFVSMHPFICHICSASHMMPFVFYSIDVSSVCDCKSVFMILTMQKVDLRNYVVKILTGSE